MGARSPRGRARPMAAALVAAALWASWGCTSGAVESQPRVFGLYAVWFEGSNDENRARIDDFLECLVDGSTLNHFWRGEARVELRGSWALTPPPGTLDWDALADAWLVPAVGRSDGLPAPRAHETPLYLVFGGHPDLWTNACGRNATAAVEGRTVGLGIVRNSPLCWATGERLRTETQIALHEIVETVDRVLGHGTCAAGGACRGRGICEDPCDTFVGLRCPGAPTDSFTGCDGGRVDGWVIQKLGYAGRDPARCGACAACDFTVEVCPPDDPRCGQAPLAGESRP